VFTLRCTVDLYRGKGTGSRPEGKLRVYIDFFRVRVFFYFIFLKLDVIDVMV